MAGEYIFKSSGVERAGFDEQEDAAVILGPPGGEGYSDKMLGGHDADGNTGHVSFAGRSDGFLFQWSGGRQKLHRPVTNADVVAFSRIPAGQQVFVNRSEREQCAAGGGGQVTRQPWCFSR